MQQLNYLKTELIAKVNEAMDQGLVKEIHLKGGTVRSSAAKPQQAPKRRKLTEEEQSWIREQAEAAPDPELRAVFENLIRRDREHREND